MAEEHLTNQAQVHHETGALYSRIPMTLCFPAASLWPREDEMGRQGMGRYQQGGGRVGGRGRQTHDGNRTPGPTVPPTLALTYLGAAHGCSGFGGCSLVGRNKCEEKCFRKAASLTTPTKPLWRQFPLGPPLSQLPSLRCS